MVSHGLQFIEHGGDMPRHAALIGCGMAGLSLLDGALDVNGGIAAGRPGRIRQAPDGPRRTDDDRLPIGAAGENLIGATSSCRPPTNVMENGAAEPARSGLHSTDTMLAKEQCE